MGVSRRSRLRMMPTVNGAPRRILPSTVGTYYRLWDGGPWAVQPRSLPRGWQQMRLRVPLRRATCEEADCQKFLNGWVDPITEKYFPPGTPCPLGDLTAPDGADSHTTWDGTPVKYLVQVGGMEGVRTVEETEFIDTLCEGFHTFEHIQKHGL